MLSTPFSTQLFQRNNVAQIQNGSHQIRPRSVMESDGIWLGSHLGGKHSLLCESGSVKQMCPPVQGNLCVSSVEGNLCLARGHDGQHSLRLCHLGTGQQVPACF